MYDDIALKVSALDEPTAFNLKSFDELLLENIDIAKEILGKDWLPLDSDPYMKKIRVLTLRQVYNQVAKKESIKQILVTTATNEDLDNLGASLNVFREKGEYPYAKFEFKLLSSRDSDVVIPAGVVLSDDDDIYKAVVVDDVVIPAGDMSCEVVAELEMYAIESDVKTEVVVTELAFATEVRQLEVFKNGNDVECDDRYRVRIIASNNSLSTAGSEEAYKYFIYSADSRIDDVSIPSTNKPLEVDIYIASFNYEVDNLMIQRVKDVLSPSKTRPLGDLVSVYPAEIVELSVTATVELFDLLKQSDVDARIRANFEQQFFIGQDFVRSDFIRKIHVNDVYRVTSSFEDIIVDETQIIVVKDLNIEYAEAKI